MWGLWSPLECFSLDLVKIYGSFCLGKHKRIFHLHLHPEVGFAFKDRGRSRGRVQGVRNPSPPCPSEMTCDFLIQLVFCEKKTMWFIGVEVEEETSAPPPKENPGSAPGS